MSENTAVSINSIKRTINRYLLNSKNEDSQTREVLIEMFENWAGGCPRAEYITEEDRKKTRNSYSVGYRKDEDGNITYDDCTRVKFL